jgi:hypothetical protein
MLANDVDGLYSVAERGFLMPREEWKYASTEPENVNVFVESGSAVWLYVLKEKVNKVIATKRSAFIDFILCNVFY